MKKKVFREKYNVNKMIEELIEKTGAKVVKIQKVKKSVKK